MRQPVKSLLRSLARTKTLDHESLVTTELSRCLGVADLTAIGVGGTLGAGIYVLAGEVAREEAGPAIVLSFLIAAVVSMLSGLCYAEFGARVPKAGSAYIYSYVTVGEFLAFVIGWSMIMDNIIAAATVGKAWSQYLDSIVNGTISTSIKANVGSFDSPWFGDYPDILAFALLIVLTFIVAVGAKMSTVVMMGLTGVNLLVIVFVIVAGAFYVEGENWTSNKGFFPYGASGVFAGAATCFYAYVGFDAIATSGEEAKNPSRAIPIAITLTLLICMVCYISVSAILTLMVPYDLLSPFAPLAEVFQQRGMPAGRYIVAIGSLLGLSSAMLGSIFPLPRIIYAMAKDGLLFRFLSRVNARTDVPVIAAVVSGIVTAIMALIFNLEQLVEMMSIGTLLSYSLVAASVLLLRYHPKTVGLSKDEVKEIAKLSKEGAPEESISLVEKSAGKYIKYTDAAAPDEATDTPDDPASSKPEEPSSRGGYGVLQNETTDPTEGEKKKARAPPTAKTYMIVVIAFTILVVIFCSLSALLAFGMDSISRIEWWSITLLCLFLAAIVCLTVVIETQPQNRMELYFKTPFVPFLPLVALLCNTYLMLKLSGATWARLIIWLVVGLSIYFAYGIRHSVENQKRKEDAPSTTMSEDPHTEGAVDESKEDEPTKEQ
ncbi:cationic amino acid transporter 2-like [Patiria miniata]|uniref:Cationic amino acid transporter C-terminal domain-containing protein n=1 Tax=Patiria miniata TaxID=46514 RepID=A0A914BK87_PATMI|nr:cationic amino acid transporter 2-like [Patiria miniata]